MDWIKNSSSMFILVSLHFLTGLSTSSSSEGVFVSQYSTGSGRNLLQTPIPCPRSFEFDNYTIITSQCKAPDYPQKQCCDAFIQFACPFAQYLNNYTKCSEAMFSYINAKGHYPADVFSGCKGDQKGLPCPAPPPSSPADSSGSLVKCKPSPVSVIATLTLIVLLTQFILGYL